MCMSAKCMPPLTRPKGLPKGKVMFQLLLKLHMIVLHQPLRHARVKEDAPYAACVVAS